MQRWENNVFGLVPKAEWLDVGFEVTRQDDPIDSLFDDKKTDNLFAEWEMVASEYQIPMMAQFHGFDTESQTTFRIPVDRKNIEKGLIKVKINQSERMRALLNSGVQDTKIKDYILRDGINLAEQVFTRSKVAKNEVMATGAMTINENGLNLTIDYGVPAAQKAHTIDLVSTGDIVSQIQTIIDAANAAGVKITGMMTSRKNITKMRNNAGLQRDINGTSGVGALVRVNDFNDFMSEEFGIDTIISNDLTYGASATFNGGRPSVVAHKYYPENKCTFFAANPNGKLGTGLWGDPPEVDIAKFGTTGGTESSVSPYVYVSQYKEDDPAVIWTKASALFVPVLYNPNSLFIATLSDSGA